MLLAAFDEAREFTPADVLAARSLGALASMALANTRLHEQTLRSLAEAERRAATDPLTGPRQPPRPSTSGWTRRCCGRAATAGRWRSP